MFDGTVNGSLLNTFALNGAAYNVEASGTAVSKTSSDLNSTLRQTVNAKDQVKATGTFNFSFKGSASGYAMARAVSLLQTSKRTAAQLKNRSRAQSNAVITLRRSMAFKGTGRAVSKSAFNRRVAYKSLGVARAQNRKCHFIRRQILSSHTITFSISSANIRSFSRISGAGLSFSLQQATAVRRVSMVSAAIERAIQDLRATRRINLNWYATAKILGRVKLPHIRFKAIDDYRSLKNTKDIRRIVVRRTNDQLFVPADNRSAAVSRSNRSITIPNFEEGK